MSKKVSQLHRRQFLKSTVSALGAAVVAPTIIPSSALGRQGSVPPSERIIVGGIGIGNRGTYDLSCFLQQQDVQFAAVCDIKRARRDAVKQIADKQYGNQNCATYVDFRELLDRSDIDAVLIATGPNWHALASFIAAKAGKDIYCEKPCTKNIAQSLQLAEVMRRTGRVFQVGTQRRNLPHFAFACELARTGKLASSRRYMPTRAGCSR
jgi:predicted dehydrogenase